MLRDRDGALAYEAFPLQSKGATPAVLLAEEALAEFRRANNWVVVSGRSRRRNWHLCRRLLCKKLPEKF